MLIFKIFLVLIGVLLLILFLPVHLSVTFNGNLKVRTGILFINYTLYPRPPISEEKKKKKQFKKERKQAKEKKQLSQAEEMLKQDGVWAVIEYYVQMGKLLKSAAIRLIRTITVDKLNLNIIVASDDAAQTAIDYGKICAVIYPVQALIESTMRVRRRSINISTDFLRNSGEFEGDIKIHVIPIRVLWAALLFFIGYIGNTTSEKIAQQ